MKWKIAWVAGCLLVTFSCKPETPTEDQDAQVQSGAIGHVGKTFGIFGGKQVRSFLWSFPLEATKDLALQSSDPEFQKRRKKLACWYRLNVEDPSFFSPETPEDMKDYICSAHTKTLSNYGISTDHLEKKLVDFGNSEHKKFWATQFAFSAGVLGKCTLAIGSLVGAMSCGAAIGWVNQFYDQKGGGIDGGASAALASLENKESLSFDAIEAVDKVLQKTFAEHKQQIDQGNRFWTDYISTESCPAAPTLKICRGRKSRIDLPKAFGNQKDGSLKVSCILLPNGKKILRAETAGLTSIHSGSITGRIDHIDDLKWGRIQIYFGDKKMGEKVGRFVLSSELDSAPKSVTVKAYSVDELWQKPIENSRREKTFTNIECKPHL